MMNFLSSLPLHSVSIATPVVASHILLYMFFLKLRKLRGKSRDERLFYTTEPRHPDEALVCN